MILIAVMETCVTKTMNVNLGAVEALSLSLMPDACLHLATIAQAVTRLEDINTTTITMLTVSALIN